MRIGVPHISRLSASLETLRHYSLLTATHLDDDFVALMQRIADDEQSLENVTCFVNWIPYAADNENLEPDLRRNLEPYRALLLEIRENLHSQR